MIMAITATPPTTVITAAAMEVAENVVDSGKRRKLAKYGLQVIHVKCFLS